MQQTGLENTNLVVEHIERYVTFYSWIWELRLLYFPTGLIRKGEKNFYTNFFGFKKKNDKWGPLFSDMELISYGERASGVPIPDISSERIRAPSNPTVR